ncbi:hypothetical protein [Peribacillus huizhouensis]|uniref:Transposase InsO family protein n=1 Tax=Peribacillus huizhouensis TaxID=1501239 RepID=A0ABR6CQ97_9BACI|nr:hypothetical protein [Peribacillus huizhouensis]MBA9027199.1 transposase InsO family protein [Peribacillus huizhouensis]
MGYRRQRIPHIWREALSFASTRLCNGEFIAYTVMKRPVYKLVGDKLDKTSERLQPRDPVILHPDQGWHY